MLGGKRKERAKGRPMKLFMSTSSPFARKARIVLREHGLENQVEEIVVSPLDDPAELRAVNPLGTIPTLVCDDGCALCDSKLITEYLDTRHTPTFYPADATRWEALERAALAEGIMHATVSSVFERRRTDAEASQYWLARWRKAIEGTLGVLAQHTDKPNRFDIGDVGLAVALEYIDFRMPEIDWRERFPALSGWLERHRERPSLVSTRPQ